MALYPNPQENLNGFSGKTHTNLVVSEGNAPAEQFIVSKTNASAPFIYEYGPEGNQTVLIAKGKIVEAVGEEMNREKGFMETAIRVAGEDSENAIGVNHHNVYDQRRGAMEGNRPTVITRSYIEVPLFEHASADTAATTAAAMHFGAAYGVAKELKSGDFVVAGKDGNFKKFDKATHAFHQVVGQVLNVNRQLPPAGLLAYYTGLKNAQMEDYVKAISAVPATTGGEFPYGAPYTVGAWRKDFVKALGGGAKTGIPFLTDGYYSAKETLTAKLNEADKVEAAVGSKGVQVADATVTVAEDVVDASVFVKMKHKIDPRPETEIKVTYTASAETVTVPARDIHVDKANNTIVIYLDGGVVATDLTITVDSVVNPTAGIPTEWDYKGSVGAARILLLR